MAPKRDPRPYQVAVLTSLLVYGVTVLDFEVAPLQAVLILTTALLTQLVFSGLWNLSEFDPRSALISSLSLALLMRTNAPELAMLAAVIAIGSKFLFRVRGKHVFNPTCFALVASMALTDGGTWVSAGQWGSAALFGFAVAGLGMLVLFRSARSDITWTFMAAYAALLMLRALWLGDPLSIPLHALHSGAFLIFSFFMISDPKTIPDSRPGRILFALLVAAGAVFVQFGLYRANGLLWSLACCAPLVPILDWLLPGDRYAWTRRANAVEAKPIPTRKGTLMRHPKRRLAAASLALAMLVPWDAMAFCGFYVAKADTQLFNKASQVVLVRDGDRTVITMSNDFQGDPDEFAMVIPVPTFIEKEQIHIGDRKVIEHLDAYTAPRLVEYFDPDPCQVVAQEMMDNVGASRRLSLKSDRRRDFSRSDGVVIEAQYNVGEYEILILSAEESHGLARWLRRSGYQLPRGAEPVLNSYLKQGMRFFVAKVNLEEHSKLGYSYLRPIQVAYESPKFMLPIRLGTLNADGTQELFVYTLTRKGRVETTNYRTVKLPSNLEIPTYVKGEFGDFYKALFDEQVRRENMRTVFTEYAWDMNWCDPCAADPLSHEELRGLGVFWLDAGKPRVGPKSGARDVFVTRLHVRYDRDHFPADLVFQETSDRTNFQGRYVLRHAFTGSTQCEAGTAYRKQLRERQEREAQTLANLTGWDLARIRDKIGVIKVNVDGPDQPWWQRIWN